MKQKTTASILSAKELAPDIYEMWLETPLASHARPGQFLCLYPKDKSTLLPRPISICEIDAPGNALRIVYRIAGAGTREFSGYGKGDSVSVLGPLGNGYPPDAGKGKKVFLMGGGIGIPPLLELAKELSAEKQIILGYRDRNLFLAQDFEKYGKVYPATEDGSAGTKGNVMDAVRENGLRRMSFSPAVPCRCSGPSGIMLPLTGYRPTSLWRSTWPAAWAPVWAAL